MTIDTHNSRKEDLPHNSQSATPAVPFLKSYVKSAHVRVLRSCASQLSAARLVACTSAKLEIHLCNVGTAGS